MRGSVASQPHYTILLMAHYLHSFSQGRVSSFVLSFDTGVTTHVEVFSLSSLQISFGWSTVRIDMSAVRQFQPLMPFSVPAFAATLFALGLALGTTIAVGMLFFIQVNIS